MPLHPSIYEIASDDADGYVDLCVALIHLLAGYRRIGVNDVINSQSK